MTDCEITYKIRIDGVMRPEDHHDFEAAMDAAKKEFQADHSLRCAEIYKNTRIYMGVNIINKDYGK